MYAAKLEDDAQGWGPKVRPKGKTERRIGSRPGSPRGRFLLLSECMQNEVKGFLRTIKESRTMPAQIDAFCSSLSLSLARNRFSIVQR